MQKIVKAHKKSHVLRARTRITGVNKSGPATSTRGSGHTKKNRGPQGKRRHYKIETPNRKRQNGNVHFWHYSIGGGWRTLGALFCSVYSQADLERLAAHLLEPNQEEVILY